MSQKSFEDIENKIREAAANSEPAFDEQAWLKMELLLNKENSNKRRFFIWWRYGLPVLLIAVGLAGYWYFNNAPVIKNKTGIVTTATTFTNNKKPDVTSANSVKLNVDQGNNKAIFTEKSISGQDTIQLKDAGSFKNKISREYKNLVHQQQDITDNHLTVSKTSRAKNVRVQKKGSAAIKISDSEVLSKSDVTLNDNEITSDNTTEKTQPIITTGKESNDLTIEKIMVDSVKNNVVMKDAEPTKADKKLIISPSKAIKKPLSAKGLPKWYVLAAVGAEVSGVKPLIFTNSAITPRYGVGIGFQLNKKISVQTGFYAGRKKYIGGPGDYHPKPGSYWGMVDIKKVGASCLVYDIPVTVRYNIVQKSSFIFYGTAGLSSFIMKKEDYNYHYSYNNIYYVSNKAYTGNKNLFSMFTISGGVEKKLGTQFSFLAEPYLSFPLSGVGEGSVKLYSAGLQFGLKYSPSFK